MLMQSRNRAISHPLEQASTNTKKLLHLKEIITKQVLHTPWLLIYQLKNLPLRKVRSCQVQDNTQPAK